MDGIKNSKYENIVIMDGDLQHKPSCLKKMIKIYLKDFNEQIEKIKGDCEYDMAIYASSIIRLFFICSSQIIPKDFCK